MIAMRAFQDRLRHCSNDAARLINHAKQKRGVRPLFVAVDVLTSERKECSAFVRNISRRSLGLFSNVVLPEQRLQVVIRDLWGQRFELCADVIASCSVYSGWFASEANLIEGGQFDALRLWLARQVDSLNRRHSVRYPLFESAQFLPVRGPLQQILIRDVSANGVGLAHTERVNSELGMLIGPHGEEVNVMQIWQRECGENMHISGWKFQRSPRTLIESL